MRPQELIGIRTAWCDPHGQGAFAALLLLLLDMHAAVGLQILKEEEELSRAFGSGPVLPKPKVPSNGEAEPQMTKIMIFGNANQCETAQRMIQEAIENKVRCWSV